ncbi:PDZ domain-containing protein [Candidatus Saccharibacteria bacterium]|nr:PDZ domain-containing protein [Candidatus Saccharibacteria bacterium]
MRLKRFLKSNLFLILAFLFVFAAGWQLGFSGLELSLKLNPPTIKVENKTPPSSTVDFSLLWEVIERINTDYLFRPVDGTKLLYGAISGLVEALGDPYTSFLDPQENEQFEESLNGVYEGIGAEIGIRNDQLIIVAPLDGSPAKAVGVRAGDKILEVDGVTTVGVTIAEAVAKIRGAAGSSVVLTLQRDNDPSFEVTITRAQIKVESVSWQQKGDGIYYIKVSRFGEGTNEEWDEVVGGIRDQGSDIRGIVLDLRSNPGGYLSSAVYLASEFLERGTVVIQEDSSGTRKSLSSQSTTNDHAFSGVKIIVLIDGGSASASEILAAALSERTGAKLVGEKTFGKGTVQDAVDFEDGSGLHISVAKWLTSRGVWVHEDGLEPDYNVALSEEDINAERDPQLDKALELLK